MKPTATCDISIAPSLRYIAARPKREFDDQRLKQGKVTITHKK